MSDQRTKYNSKILLFGEYSVLHSSMALAIPYPLFEGELTFRKGRRQIDSELIAFVDYLKELKDNGEDFMGLDVNSLEFDVKQGLYFDSTIPQGYGVGSSGALCAAVFDRYTEDIDWDINILKDNFSKMESHFHGASSGFDPLVSFIDRSILVDDAGRITPVDLPSFHSGDGAIFLLNTGRARRTEPLVNLYLEKLKIEDFRQLCEVDLKGITNNCIIDFLESNIVGLFSHFRQLSELQYNHFTPMIPKLYLGPWKEGLDSELYSLKLCGAGGGGLLLGITNNFTATRKKLDRYQLRKLYSL